MIAVGCIDIIQEKEVPNDLETQGLGVDTDIGMIILVWHVLVFFWVEYPIRKGP